MAAAGVRRGARERGRGALDQQHFIEERARRAARRVGGKRGRCGGQGANGELDGDGHVD